MSPREVAALGRYSFSMPAWNEVHVWIARLDSTPRERELLQKILGADERKRAQSFVYEADYCRYIAGRGILRSLLANYLGLRPEVITFAYGSYGKPRLAYPLAESDLRFNLSHAGAWIVYAIAHRREVGIDIELLQRDVAWRALVPWVFSATEQAALSETPADQKMEAFFQGWTRKEAYLKGCGDGLSHPMNSFEVPLAPMKSPSLVNIGGRGRWWLHAIDSIAGYAGALAVEGVPARPFYRYLDAATAANGGWYGNELSPQSRWGRRLQAIAAQKIKIQC
ncbi:4'-phosphopantetheinyl transferase family protein [Nitrosococcus oceani]|uniref:4'-phosphopantetheinyl transferase family protein n=1 Tax=Nitrosococcus oceani TaxID=1229 RepID=UPI000689731B|nr:4'-phosphopantetheinyl transferase superfamily protein [Nitrosococcus oceani]